MTQLPKNLREALEADEAGDLDRLIRSRRPRDFEVLRSLLSLDSSIPPDFRTKATHALGRWGDASGGSFNYSGFHSSGEIISGFCPHMLSYSSLYLFIRTQNAVLPQLDEPGRISALSALGRLGTPEATAAILEHTDDPSPQVRKTAALALSRIGTPEASAKLRELAASDPLPWIRELAARH